MKRELKLPRPFAYGVICKDHGLCELDSNRFNSLDGFDWFRKWVCPKCSKPAMFDDRSTFGKKVSAVEAKVTLSAQSKKRFKSWGGAERFIERIEEKFKAANKLADGEIWTSIELIYETRWDCRTVRLAAAKETPLREKCAHPDDCHGALENSDCWAVCGGVTGRRRFPASFGGRRVDVATLRFVGISATRNKTAN